MSSAIRVATRGSALARRQAELVVARLRRHRPGLEVTVVEVAAAGDLLPETPPADLPGDGWFSSALERSLVEGMADLAVHSAKDLPTRLDDALRVVAYLPRDDPRDAMVTRDGSPWRELRDGSRVATGSPRRAAQLLALRPGLRVEPIRGNVDTRLRRLADGAAEALMVAMAGLDRLGLAARGQPLDPHQECTPAPAQGVIAVEARTGSAAEVLAGACDDAPTRACVEAERLVLAALGGGCRLPLGVLAEADGAAGMVLSASFQSPSDGPGARPRRVTLRGPAGSGPRLAAELAARLAARLR